MKRVYVNEEWCLGCHLCEYYCAGAHSGYDDLAKATLLNAPMQPRILVEESGDVCFAVSCRHCEEALCVKSCITGALSMEDGVVLVDEERCVGCLTCVCACPYGCIREGDGHVATKCDLCIQEGKTPACVAGCPNGAIVFEEAVSK